MAKYYEPLDRATFDTIHWLVLEYIDCAKEKGQAEALEEMTPEIVTANITIEDTVSYMLDRMIIERGGVPQDRGNIFATMEKKFKKDVAANVEATVAKQKSEFPELDKHQHMLLAQQSLLLTNYFPLLVSLQVETPLDWALPEVESL